MKLPFYTLLLHRKPGNYDSAVLCVFVDVIKLIGECIVQVYLLCYYVGCGPWLIVTLTMLPIAASLSPLMLCEATIPTGTVLLY